MQRHDAASTLRRRYFYVMCLPGVTLCRRCLVSRGTNFVGGQRRLRTGSIQLWDNVESAFIRWIDVVSTFSASWAGAYTYWVQVYLNRWEMCLRCINVQRRLRSAEASAQLDKGLYCKLLKSLAAVKYINVKQKPLPNSLLWLIWIITVRVYHFSIIYNINLTCVCNVCICTPPHPAPPFPRPHNHHQQPNPYSFPTNVYIM